MKTNVLLFVYSGDIEPIPSIIQNAIDHLCQWRLIPESRKPNSCVINFFDEVCIYNQTTSNSSNHLCGLYLYFYHML